MEYLATSPTNIVIFIEMSTENNKPIIFFDGVCNLCNRFVDFLIRRDKYNRFFIASLQGKTATDKLSGLENIPDSVVLLYGGKLYFESSAVLKIFSILARGWQLTSIFWLIPKPLRDHIYKYIARNRYNWFGKKEACRLPTQEEREKFLE